MERPRLHKIGPMSVHDARNGRSPCPESVFTILGIAVHDPWNRCSRCVGMGVHDGLESAFRIARNVRPSLVEDACPQDAGHWSVVVFLLIVTTSESPSRRCSYCNLDRPQCPRWTERSSAFFNSSIVHSYFFPSSPKSFTVLHSLFAPWLNSPKTQLCSTPGRPNLLSCRRSLATLALGLPSYVGGSR